MPEFKLFRYAILQEFFLIHTKLTTLPTKVYARTTKINSAKKLPVAGIQPSTSCDLLRCLVNRTKLTFGCQSESLRALKVSFIDS